MKSDKPIILLGAGHATVDMLGDVLRFGNLIVAADGGARFALDNGHIPDAVIGDMDSISDEIRAKIPQSHVHRFHDQDSTDFDKALRSIDAPLVLAAGFLGARTDHTLAAFNVLVRRGGCVLLGEEDIIFRCPPNIAFDLPKGSIFSLFPMGSVKGQSEGLKWPIQGIDFSPNGKTGTSNQVIGPVSLKMTSRDMLVIVPRAALSTVVTQLLATPEWD
ncbi:thiamine diphosphokinase [Parasulfitobacter algicola]|nr:thiamine diphosphokinase [Sulfitobacter algicola]